MPRPFPRLPARFADRVGTVLDVPWTVDTTTHADGTTSRVILTEDDDSPVSEIATFQTDYTDDMRKKIEYLVTAAPAMFAAMAAADAMLERAKPFIGLHAADVQGLLRAALDYAEGRWSAPFRSPVDPIVPALFADRPVNERTRP